MTSMTSHRVAKGALTLILSAALGGCVTVCAGGPAAPPPPPPDGGPHHGPGHGADTGPGHDQPPPRDPAFEAAVQSCARELGLPLPPHGRPPGPPPAAAGADAVPADAAAPAPAPKPDPAMRANFAKLDACLRAKGVEPPPRRGPPQDGAVPSPAAPPTQR